MGEDKLETSASLGIHLPLVELVTEAPLGLTVRCKMDTGCPKITSSGPFIANWNYSRWTTLHTRQMFLFSFSMCITTKSCKWGSALRGSGAAHSWNVLVATWWPAASRYVVLPEPSGISTHWASLGGNPTTPRAHHFDAETRSRGKKQKMQVDTRRKKWGLARLLTDRCPVQGLSCVHEHACV